jgi:hypothetical protein
MSTAWLALFACHGPQVHPLAMSGIRRINAAKMRNMGSLLKKRMTAYTKRRGGVNRCRLDNLQNSWEIATASVLFQPSKS